MTLAPPRSDLQVAYNALNRGNTVKTNTYLRSTYIFKNNITMFRISDTFLIKI